MVRRKSWSGSGSGSGNRRAEEKGRNCRGVAGQGKVYKWIPQGTLVREMGVYVMRAMKMKRQNIEKVHVLD